MDKNENTFFKIDDESSAELKALIDGLSQFCRRHKLPYFLSIAVGNDKDTTEYINSACTASSIDMKLTINKLSKYEKVYNGHELVEPEEIREVEF